MMELKTVQIDLKRLWRTWELLDQADCKLPGGSPLVNDDDANARYRESMIRAIDSVKESRRLVNASREILVQECGHTAEEIDKVWTAAKIQEGGKDAKP